MVEVDRENVHHADLEKRTSQSPWKGLEEVAPHALRNAVLISGCFLQSHTPHLSHWSESPNLVLQAQVEALLLEMAHAIDDRLIPGQGYSPCQAAHSGDSGVPAGVPRS